MLEKEGALRRLAASVYSLEKDEGTTLRGRRHAGGDRGW